MITFISDYHNTRFGGIIADEFAEDETLSREPEPPGRPITFFIGLGAVLAGLFIALGSLFHNHAQVFVNETSHRVFGPYDWMAAIIGSVILLVGVIILLFSKVTKAPS